MRIVETPRRVVGFDLENRPSAYWYDGETTSEITAFGWKWSDEKHVKTLLLQPDGSFMGDEGVILGSRDAYTYFVEELCEAGLVFGHNIRRHDLPMLNAALIRRQLPVLPGVLTTDTCRDLPKRDGLSYSLENLVAMYGVKGRKLTMSQPEWEEANRLTPAGIGKTRARVVSDVLLQERLRGRLLGLGLLRSPSVWKPT